MKRLLLTERALDDVQDIYEYSVEQWGEVVASRYIRGFEECFSLLKSNEGLLKINRKISSRFIAYPIQRHVLICDIIDDAVCILTVRHSSMDLMVRLRKLEPTLDEEAKALFKKM
ncbi:toxin ParE [Kordia sp. SMS9]|uniref:type II toxin-antitoxin system RelE/ParE family toxin n=1 Tax=Kordia sp. SMS9 TaxID=2282170 RepID=UPI000E0D3C1B|nr:type II toxin-antitoxin system RelE/ParE family toxin [Kordia sp. SMS9]AXG69601.1 toxin ParE [Kordia sp. SMS9]